MPPSTQMVIHIPNGASTSEMFDAANAICSLGSQTFQFAISECVVLVGAPPNAPPSGVDSPFSPPSSPTPIGAADETLFGLPIAAAIAIIVICSIVGLIVGMPICRYVYHHQKKVAEGKRQPAAVEVATGPQAPSASGGATGMRTQEVKVEMQQLQHVQPQHGRTMARMKGAYPLEQMQQQQAPKATVEVASATEAEAAQARASAEEKKIKITRQKEEDKSALAQELPQPTQSGKLEEEPRRRSRRESTQQPGAGLPGEPRRRSRRESTQQPGGGPPEESRRRSRRESTQQSGAGPSQQQQPGAAAQPESRRKRSSKPA